MQNTNNVNFQLLIDSYYGYKISPKGLTFDLDAVVGRLFQEKPDHPDFEDLIRDVSKVYPGNRGIVSKTRDHIFLVCKAPVNVPFCLGVVDVSVKAFAKGGGGKVYPVQMHNSNVELVLKLSRKNRNKKKKVDPLKAYERERAAREDLRAERKMMEYIAKNASDTTGLNCHVIGRVTYENQKGIFIKKYDMDGFDFIDFNPHPECRIWAILDLVKGMSTLHGLNIFHRDLKPGNVLIKEGNGEDFEAVISDFGSAVHMNDLFTKNHPHPTLKEILGSHTPQYGSGLILDKLDGCLHDLRKYRYGSDDYEVVFYEIVDLMYMYDEFSMSLILYRLATGLNPRFDTFSDGEYFEFNNGMTADDQYALVDEMISEVQHGCNMGSPEDADLITHWFIDYFTQGLKFSSEPLPAHQDSISLDEEFLDNEHVRKKKRYNSG